MRNIFFGLLLLSTTAVAQSDSLAYVFEVVRHGARAPLNSFPPGQFQVGTGMLTAQGMRHRNLLGRFNRDKYVYHYKLLDETYNPNQIYVQSTDVDRTIQSGYAELMGLYPPGTSGQKLTKGQLNNLLTGKALPPLKIRQAHSRHLKHFSHADTVTGLVEDYVQIPVYNFIDDNLLDFDDCPYADTQNTDTWHNHPEIFDQLAADIMPIVRHPLAVSQGYNPTKEASMTFKNAYSICDKLKAQNFEGVPRNYYFTTEEWGNMRTLQKWVLIKPFTDYSRTLGMTKLMMIPLQKMQARVDLLLQLGHDIQDDIKYVLNSAHDDQIANILWWLNPYQYTFTDIPYASSIFYELHYNQTCLDSDQRDEYCFTVHVEHDGRPLRFDTCLQNNLARGSQSTTCTYPDFKLYMKKISNQGDVNDLCMQPYAPPSKKHHHHHDKTHFL